MWEFSCNLKFHEISIYPSSSVCILQYILYLYTYIYKGGKNDVSNGLTIWIDYIMISWWIELIRIKSSWHATLQCTSLSRIFNSCASEKRSAVTAFNKQTVQLQKKKQAVRSKNAPPKKKSGFLGSKLHESVAPDSAVPDKRCRNNEVSEMSHRKHGSAVCELKTFLKFKSKTSKCCCTCYLYMF